MEGKKDIRNLIKNGDSVSITIPPEFLTENGLKLGDRVELTYDGILILRPLDQDRIGSELEKVESAEEVEKSDPAKV